MPKGVTSLNIKNENGSFTKVPIVVKAKNVKLNNGKNLEDSVAYLDTETFDSGIEDPIRTPLYQEDVVDHLYSSSSITPLSAAQGKVLQNEIDTLKTAGTIPSDTLSSEIIDIRNGANGKVYTSAGTAVRSQLGTKEDNKNKITSKHPITGELLAASKNEKYPTINFLQQFYYENSQVDELIEQAKNQIGTADWAELKDLRVGADGEQYDNAGLAVRTNIQKVLDKIKASFYRNVAEMKADMSLKTNMTAVVLGYYEPNDGGAAEYHIGNSGNLPLNNGLRAQIVIKPQMAVECFGAKGDGKTDDSGAIKEASSYDTLVTFKNKTYLISKCIYIENDIHWVGSDTKIKIADNITIDETKRYIIKVSGGTNVEGISIDYCSSYTSNNTKPAITLFKIVWDSTEKRIGKKHTLKNVNINVTEAKGIKAEIMPVWYDIVKARKSADQGGGEEYDDVIRDFHAVNCNISNLTTGRPTGTGCLWTTGIKGNIVVENCKFTRNHRGELLVFWVGDGNINNILVDNCEFNATNDIKSSAAIFGVGASVKYPTSANNVSVNNTIFNIGKGSGASCIQCTHTNTTVNINNCKFIKNVPIDPDEVVDKNNEAEIMHKRRLSIALMEEGSIINFYNCYFNNVYSNLHLCETRNASITPKLCEMNVFNSSINAYNFIYNMSSNSNFYNTNISTTYATGRFMTSNSIQAAISFKNCRLDCGILNTCSMTMLDSECFKEITNNIKTTNLNVMMMNNTLKDACSINMSSDVQLNSLIMTDNLMHSLNITKNEEVVELANIHVMADKVFCINNCDTVNNVLLPNSDKSRMVEGTGILTTSSTGTDYINSADYEYQKIGRYVNVHVYVDFKASTPPNGMAFTLKGLPYSCGNLVNPRCLCVTTQKKQMIAAMNTGSSELTIICTSTDSFVENEKLSFLFRYKIA